MHKQRAALLLSNGVVYVGFGGDGNRGALFAFDAADAGAAGDLELDAHRRERRHLAIRVRARPPMPRATSICMTGNGTFDADDQGRQNYGNSFVKLKLEGGQTSS